MLMAVTQPPQPAPRMFAPAGALGGAPGPGSTNSSDCPSNSDEETGWESSTSNEMVPVDAPSSPGTPKSTTTSTRRLIKVDFSKLQIEDDDLDEDRDDEDSVDGGADCAPRSNPWHRTGSGRGCPRPCPRPCPRQGQAPRPGALEGVERSEGQDPEGSEEPDPLAHGGAMRDAYLSYCDSALECRPPTLNKNRPSGSGSACSVQ